jgi:hypothetical protein
MCLRASVLPRPLSFGERCVEKRPKRRFQHRGAEIQRYTELFFSQFFNKVYFFFLIRFAVFIKYIMEPFFWLAAIG